MTYTVIARTPDGPEAHLCATPADALETALKLIKCGCAVTIEDEDGHGFTATEFSTYVATKH
jgi:azurin